jgi:hypothetical protein
MRLAWVPALLLLATAAIASKEEPVFLESLPLPTLDVTQTIDPAALRGKKLLLIEFASW